MIGRRLNQSNLTMHLNSLANSTWYDPTTTTFLSYFYSNNSNYCDYNNINNYYCHECHDSEDSSHDVM